MDALLQAGAKVDLLDELDATPLILATRENSFKSVKLLINKCGYCFMRLPGSFSEGLDLLLSPHSSSILDSVFNNYYYSSHFVGARMCSP